MTPWVRIAVDMVDDPRVNLLSEQVNLHAVHTVGHLVALIGKMRVHAKNGDLSQVTNRTLEQWAMWHGTRGKFATAFRHVILDATGTWAAWDRHNGAAIGKAEREAERLRVYRERVALAQEQGAALDDPSQIRTRTVRVRKTTRTRDVRGTRQDITTTTTPLSNESGAAPTTNWVTSGHEIMLAAGLGGVSPGQLGAALKPLVDAQGEAVILRAWKHYCKLAPSEDKPQFVGPASFAKQAASWIQRSAPFVPYDEQGEPTDALLRLAGVTRGAA